MFRSARRRDEAGAPAQGIADALRASGLVDADYYREANPDVAAIGMDPVDHYAATGASEARNPNPYFDSAWYVCCQCRRARGGAEPAVPLHIGRSHARAAAQDPTSDTAYYLAQNPEVGDSGMNPLLHYHPSWPRRGAHRGAIRRGARLSKRR